MIPELFLERKAKIIAHLTLPDSDYTDASPKGTVDVGIRDLINEINGQDGLVTTSSCAGRVSVFLEGNKARAVDASTRDAGEDANVESNGARLAGAVGGKGGGGRWLYVSHEPFHAAETQTWESVLFGGACMVTPGVVDEDEKESFPARLIHFKFEPMILHILTASPEHAQSVIRCGLQAGFRESGAINLTAHQELQHATPIVAIRSMGLGLESIIGMHTAGRTRCNVSPEYLAMLVKIANERFQQNMERIARFRQALSESRSQASGKCLIPGWEDADTRRERKKAEGLKIKAELAIERERLRLEKQDVSEVLPFMYP